MAGCVTRKLLVLLLHYYRARSIHVLPLRAPLLLLYSWAELQREEFEERFLLFHAHEYARPISICRTTN